MHYHYDATQDKCPLPLVKLRVILKKMREGDECFISIADKGSKSDIPKLLHKQGYTFMKNDISPSVIEFHIKL